FTLAFEAETLEHRSSDEGVNEVDDSATLAVNRNTTLTLEDVSRDNLGLVLLGEAAVVSQSASTVTDEAIASVVPGHVYQLGETASNPSGVRGLEEHSSGVNVVVNDDDSGSPTTFDEGDDYEVDMDLGLLYIVPGGAITEGTNLEVSYKTAASNREQVVSGNTPVLARLKYVADNVKGANRDIYIPRVRLVPNGEYNLKS